MEIGIFQILEIQFNWQWTLEMESEYIVYLETYLFLFILIDLPRPDNKLEYFFALKKKVHVCFEITLSSNQCCSVKSLWLGYVPKVPWITESLCYHFSCHERGGSITVLKCLNAYLRVSIGQIQLRRWFSTNQIWCKYRSW